MALFTLTSQAVQAAIDIFEDCVPSIVSIHYAPVTIATVGEHEFMECSIATEQSKTVL